MTKRHQAELYRVWPFSLFRKTNPHHAVVPRLADHLRHFACVFSSRLWAVAVSIRYAGQIRSSCKSSLMKDAPLATCSAGAESTVTH